jgi:hypothetical protein
LPRSADEIYQILKAGILRARAVQSPRYCLGFDLSQEDRVIAAWAQFKWRDRSLLRQISRADVQVDPEERRLKVLVIEFRPDEQWCLVLGGQVND